MEARYTPVARQQTTQRRRIGGTFRPSLSGIINVARSSGDTIDLSERSPVAGDPDGTTPQRDMPTSFPVDPRYEQHRRSNSSPTDRLEPPDALSTWTWRAVR